MWTSFMANSVRGFSGALRAEEDHRGDEVDRAGRHGGQLGREREREMCPKQYKWDLSQFTYVSKSIILTLTHLFFEANEADAEETDEAEATLEEIDSDEDGLAMSMSGGGDEE